MTPLLRELAARCDQLRAMRDRLHEIWSDTAPNTQDARDYWCKYMAAKSDAAKAHEELAVAVSASMPKKCLSEQLEASLRAARSVR